MWALKEGLSSDALPHRYGEQKAKPKTARYGQQRTERSDMAGKQLHEWMVHHGRRWVLHA